MKKCLLLLIAAVLACSLFACAPAGDKNGEPTNSPDDGSSSRPSNEIEFEVPSDSDVPEPVYTDETKLAVSKALFDVVGQEAPDEIVDEIAGVFRRAKISDERLSAIAKFVSDNKDNFLPNGEAEGVALLAVYRALYAGLKEVATPDEVGKVLYELAVMREKADSVDDTAPVCEAVGRDNFVLLSRLLFKVTDIAADGLTDELFEQIADVAGGYIIVKDMTQEQIDAVRDAYYGKTVKMLQGVGALYLNVVNSVTDREWSAVVAIAGKVLGAVDTGLSETTVRLFLDNAKSFLPALLRLAGNAMLSADKEFLRQTEDSGSMPTAVIGLILKAFDKLSEGDRTAINVGLATVLGTALPMAGATEEDMARYQPVLINVMGALKELAKGEAGDADTVALAAEIVQVLSDWMSGQGGTMEPDIPLPVAA